jgi:general secretion pathway protein A
LLEDGRLPTDADSAYASVAARWGKTYERRGDERPCDAVRRLGLACLPRRGTSSLVRQFDVPVVVETASSTGARHYFALSSLDSDRATLDFGAQRETVSIHDLEADWDGSFIVLWKPPRASVDPITPGSRSGDVVWLRQGFAMLDGQPAPTPPVSRLYDDALAARVVAFQRAHRLAADGIVGAETFAMLTARIDSTTPSLARPRTGS